MALDDRYIALTSLNEYFVDKDTGEALAGGKLYFYKNSAQSTPKTVYQLTTSGGEYVYTPLPNPVTLNAVGTAQNSGGDNVIIYAYPYKEDGSLDLELYYIVCENSDGTTQWTREAIPTITSDGDAVNDVGKMNELSNAQFSRYFLINDATDLTVSSTDQVFPIAPDWDLVASGSGTVTVQRVPVSGNSAIPTYPAYYLKITSGAGVTNPYLRQRLNKNSGLWSGVFVSGFIVAKIDPGQNALTMKYKDSSGVTSDVDLFDASLTTDWDIYGGSVEILDSSNTQSGDDAYVDIVIELPTSNSTYITSVQVLATEEEIQANVNAYDNRSANREQAFMGDYYIPKLEYKNIPSMLIGWDFPLNPRQLGKSGSVSGGTAQYIMDQTIMQTSSGLTVNWGTSTPTNGLTMNHAQADSSYALIQYMDGEASAKDGALCSKFVGTPLSVNINGYTTDGGNSAGVTEVQVKIFANSAADQFDILPTTIVDLAADGTATLTSTAVTNGWYEISRKNLPTAKGNLNVLASNGVIADDNDVGFNNWLIEDDTQAGNGVNGIAVVVSFVPAASTTDYKTNVDSISLVPGDIPTRPAPKSYTDTLQECEFYYEKSYNEGVLPGAATYENAVLVYPGVEVNSTSQVLNLYAKSFNLDYHKKRITNPTITIYSPQTGTADKVRTQSRLGSASSWGTLQNGDPTFSSYWSASVQGDNRTYFETGSASTLQAIAGTGANKADAWIKFHFVADARIGINHP